MIHFFDKTITIRRLRKIDTYRSVYSATFTAYEGCIQPMTTEQISVSEYKLGQAFHIYTDVDCVMDEGDIAVIDGKQYGVRGKDEYSFGSLSHNRYLVVKEQK